MEVSNERWKEAQKWELEVWKQESISNSHRKVRSLIRNLVEKMYLKFEPEVKMDDWNLWWFEKFEKYSFLPDTIDNMLELGCGPYTNTRLIVQKHKTNHIFCSDPLSLEYVGLNSGWLSWAHQKRLIMVDNHPAEDTPFRSDFFDVVIMINVLDHVRNAEDCLNEAIRVAKRGGICIIGQDLTNEEDFSNWPELEDTGHPISINHEILDNMLLKKFEPIIHRVLSRDEGRNPLHHYGTYVFAGVKNL